MTTRNIEINIKDKLARYTLEENRQRASSIEQEIQELENRIQSLNTRIESKRRVLERIRMKHRDDIHFNRMQSDLTITTKEVLDFISK